LHGTGIWALYARQLSRRGDMGAHVIRCYLGFSTTYTNGFSERLERRAAELSRLFCKSHTKFLHGLDSLHDAVDAALRDSESQTASSLHHGLAELAECGCDLTLMAEILLSTRMDLAERGAVDSDDPLIYRERFFAVLDYDDIYRAWATRGAILPQRVFWDEVVSAVQSGGARAGVQLLERQLKELHANLINYLRAVEEIRQLPIRELAHSLHDTSLEVSVLSIGFIRFLSTCTYMSLLCERTMLLYEQELAQMVVAAR
jgi:hypothetical protein